VSGIDAGVAEHRVVGRSVLSGHGVITDAHVRS
jgi:hypothetical protein